MTDSSFVARIDTLIAQNAEQIAEHQRQIAELEIEQRVLLKLKTTEPDPFTVTYAERIGPADALRATVRKYDGQLSKSEVLTEAESIVYSTSPNRRKILDTTFANMRERDFLVDPAGKVWMKKDAPPSEQQEGI